MEENNNYEQEQEQEECYIDYKIKPGKEYNIERQDYNGKAFYKISISKKNKDGTKYYAKKNVFFKEGVELENNTRIKIKKAFEDFWNKDKFTPIFSVFITDFEIISRPEDVINNAYDDFNNDNGLDLPF